jgi:uncharacterized integral membrane protein
MSDSELVDRTSADQQAVVKADRRHRARLVAAAIIGGVVAAFALLNLDDVKVHWLVASGQTPLILVIVVAFVLGIAVDRLVIFRAKRRQQRAAQSPDAP